ncbi:long-chain acyl-CoA synthetase [Coccidioides immitis RS]|uniref:Long-chain acyl-CoA synthetase n=1 Tax=Coccidioides immitis (strain RS) TaxID=246410 RepID=A0A0D8JUB0_COCIM|nr:long-chain acyl-CoA synthetase [Coccidioides immitis RS]KJF60546.1 long-chain acyl-CoA synthetase [Coccidioides immitis RS]
MSFAPPSGPPPPRVPEGWKAEYHDGYKEWYYVDLSTGISQWNPPPTEALAPHPSHPPTSPSSPPPSYEASGPPSAVGAVGSGPDQKIGPHATQSALGSNNPYKSQISDNSSTMLPGSPVVPDTKGPVKSPDPKKMIDEDARLAAQLQEEENERARQQGYDCVLEANNTEPNSRASNPSANYSTIAAASSTLPSQLQTRAKGGFFGKLLDKARQHAPSSSRPQQPSYYPTPAQQQPQYGYAPQQQPYGGYPPQGAGGYHAPPYSPYQNPYGQPGMQPGRMAGGRGGSGMGMAGAAALGLGGGLLGGALLANALDKDHGDGYQDGFADGGDFGGFD